MQHKVFGMMILNRYSLCTGSHWAALDSGTKYHHKYHQIVALYYVSYSFGDQLYESPESLLDLGHRLRRVFHTSCQSLKFRFPMTGRLRPSSQALGRWESPLHLAPKRLSKGHQAIDLCVEAG
jgi:hypothetical protein